MPAAPILIGAAAVSGAAAAIGTFIVGATVSTAVATAVGVGVLSAGATAIQGGSSSDILRSAVLAGVGSYVGGMVASKVSSAVSQATGAPLGTGIKAGFDASGNIVSTAGGQSLAAAGTTGLQAAAGAGSILGVAAPTAAGFLAGNVAGRATEAAITGNDIGEAALFGAAQSIGFGLNQLDDFKSLPPVAKNVLTSAAQAAVMGQDVGDAVIESLIVSTDIVTKAIKSLPNGIEFTEQNPALTRYVVNSVSSALAAQLQGKEVDEAVLASLVRTTATILDEKFQDSKLKQQVEDANSKYTQAEQERQNVVRLASQLEEVQKKYSGLIDIYEGNRVSFESDVYYANYYSGLAQDSLNQARDPKGGRTTENALEWLDYYNGLVAKHNADAAWNRQSMQDAEQSLRSAGYHREKEPLESQYRDAVNRLNALVTEIDTSADFLIESSANLFTDFETELATTLAPLTAFEDVTDVTDQDLLAEIQPVTPPEDLTQLAQDDAVLRQIQEVAARPDVGVPTDATQLASAEQLPIQTLPEVVITPGGGFYRYYRSQDGSLEVISDDNENFYIVENGVRRQVSVEEADAFLKSLPQGSGTFAPDQERSLVEELMLEEMFGGDQGTTDRAGIGLGTEISPVIPGDLTGTAGSAVIGGDTGAGTGTTTGAPSGVGVSAGTSGESTGTTGAPPIDYSLAATEMQGTPLDEQATYSVLFNYLTRGGGSPYASNKAVFDMEGGLGTAGGGSKETTFKLITINESTGEQTYDVGGKLYTLMLLPSYKKEVLVPKDPSANIVYINKDQFNQPRFVETSIEKVPFPEAEELVKQIEKSEKEGQTAGGAPAGAEGAAGGRTAEEDRVATTEEQLQPGARPEEVASGVVSEEAAPSFPDVISGITEPTIPASVPGQAAGTETGAQPPGAGGIGDEITDEDIIRLIQGELGTPGGGGEGEEELGGGEGEGQGTGEGEGTGTGTAGEGTGTGAGGEGTGPGRGGEGTGTGTGEGDGTGEGGGELGVTIDIGLPPPVITTVGRRTFRRPGEVAPYRVTGMDESGILGRKQPLFGGDEDLQRAEWNRRSLRLKRLLGL